MNNTRPQPDFGFFTAKPIPDAPTDWKDVSPYNAQRNDLAARRLAHTYRYFEQNDLVVYVTHETRIHHRQLQQRVCSVADVDLVAWMSPVAELEAHSRPATDNEVLKVAAACIQRTPRAVAAINKWLAELGLPEVQR